jgi:DNA topoisomerase-3
MICNFYLVQFFPDYEIEEEHLCIEVGQIPFRATRSRVMHLAWKKLLPEIGSDVPLGDENFPPWTPGEEVLCENVEVRPGKTLPPQRFTDASLMEAMTHVQQYIQNESLKQSFHGEEGLGTVSTRAQTIDTLFKRGYLIKGNRSIYSTALARDLIHALPAAASQMDMTASWEKKLAEIEMLDPPDAEREAEQFLQDVAERVREFIEPLKDKRNIHLTLADEVLGLKTRPRHCPRCNSVLQKRQGKFGPFWGCSAYPQCRYTEKASE